MHIRTSIQSSTHDALLNMDDFITIYSSIFFLLCLTFHVLLHRVYIPYTYLYYHGRERVCHTKIFEFAVKLNIVIGNFWIHHIIGYDLSMNQYFLFFCNQWLGYETNQNVIHSDLMIWKIANICYCINSILYIYNIILVAIFLFYALPEVCWTMIDILQRFIPCLRLSRLQKKEKIM